MVDYAMPLEHFVFSSRSEMVRHELTGTEDARPTGIVVRRTGYVPYDALGHPHVLDMRHPCGTHETVFADDLGRIAGRIGEYVANRKNRHDRSPAVPKSEEEGTAPVAQHIEHGYG